MPRVRIYTTTYCGYCWRAKLLLKRRAIPYDEIDVTGDRDQRAWLVEATGRRTASGNQPPIATRDPERVRRRPRSAVAAAEAASPQKFRAAPRGVSFFAVRPRRTRRVTPSRRNREDDVVEENRAAVVGVREYPP